MNNQPSTLSELLGLIVIVVGSWAIGWLVEKFDNRKKKRTPF